MHGMLKLALVLVCLSIGCGVAPKAESSSAGQAVRFEEYRPTSSGRLPTVILLHGGDGLWVNGSRYRASARTLADQGFDVFLVHYFERTGTYMAFTLDAIKPHYLDWMGAVRDAITVVSEQRGVESNRIALVGNSLGAALALTVASQDNRVAAVVDVSGMLPDPVIPMVRRMPPTLILHGASDSIVPVQEARKLEQFLRQRGTHYEACIYQGQGHELKGQAQSDSLRRAAIFLRKNLS
jgi:dipeptidyl aminopeptidase/acylaminoacyl peptidase